MTEALGIPTMSELARLDVELATARAEIVRLRDACLVLDAECQKQLVAASEEIGLLRAAIRDMFQLVNDAWRDRQIAKETRDEVTEVVKRVMAATERPAATTTAEPTDG